MSSAIRSLLISADAHVAENENLRARLPEHLRERMPLIVPGKGGDTDVDMNGELQKRSSWKKLSARDRELEFRTDPSLGTDLDRRLRDMAREGVDAQVIFPNITLNCGGSHQTREYSKAVARAYNEYVRETFAPDSKRFKPAAMIPTDDIEDTLAEARKSIDEGFATMFLPCVVPWQPYRLKVYEPLWSMAAEASIPLTFHVFSGNLALGGEFADAGDLAGRVKGVVIGQLLVSVIALGQMFTRYSRSFLMEEFWALTLVLFIFALGLSALLGLLEQRVEYYAGARG